MLLQGSRQRHYDEKSIEKDEEVPIVTLSKEKTISAEQVMTPFHE